MSRTSKLALAAATLLLPLTLLGQIKNEGLADGIIAARQKNIAIMQTFNWNRRTDIEQDNQLQDLRVELFSLGANGQLEKSLLNDQQGALPGGFLRKAIEKNKRKELEKYVAELTPLVDQYTLTTAGAVINFLATAQVQPLTTPDGKTILNINGKDVAAPGDTFAMTVDGRTLQPMNVNVTSTYEKDAITIQASFTSMKSGLNTLQYATISIPAKKLVINIHNYDYVSNK